MGLPLRTPLYAALTQSLDVGSQARFIAPATKRLSALTTARGRVSPGPKNSLKKSCEPDAFLGETTQVTEVEIVPDAAVLSGVSQRKQRVGIVEGRGPTNRRQG